MNGLSGKVLMRNGYWCVPAHERPSNWRDISSKELEQKATPILDDIVSAGEQKAPEAKALTARDIRIEFQELSEAVMESGKCFGATVSMVDAARVMLVGMWTRDTKVIEKVTGVRKPGHYARWFNDHGVWLDDGSVFIGEPLSDLEDLPIWMWAMAATGIIRFAGLDEDGKNPVWISRKENINFNG